MLAYTLPEKNMFAFYAGYGHEPRVYLNVHAAASPPGVPLGRTQRAWSFGNGSPGRTVQLFIVFQTNKARIILFLRKLKKNWRTKSLVGRQNSKEV